MPEKESNSMVYGKSIELFLVNGTADSIVTAELSNWNGKAIKIPRIEIADCKRDDIMQAGVYFLFCKEDDGKDSVYIGEAENVKERLIQHMRDYQAEREKYYWNMAVIFIGRDLNKALIRYLENRMVEIARNCTRYRILTKNTYRNTVMKESQVAVMEEFIDNAKILLNVLGYKVLEPYLQPEINSEDEDNQLLYLSSGNADATGILTSEGFVVRKGSKINEHISAKSISETILRLREKYAGDGYIKDGSIIKDILFSSSSAASGFVLGYSASGPRTWKTKDGQTLKDIENSDSIF